MTKKIYRSAQGKTVDLGALMLQNEYVRAVGNMNVNARGDILDSNNRIIESTTQRVQKTYQRQTNVTDKSRVVSGTRAARPIKSKTQIQPDATLDQEIETQEEQTEEIETPVVTQPEPVPLSTQIPAGGLASAIAKARAVKQELEPTLRQRLQSQPIKKI